jgi:outer membrane lipoprotein-sorting protein
MTGTLKRLSPSRLLKKDFHSPLPLSFLAHLASRMGRAVRLTLVCFAVVAAGALMAGCSLVAPPVSPPPAAEAKPGASQVGELAAALIERSRRLDAMQTEAVMQYEGGGQRVKAREEITLKRPASLRVEALTPFGVAAVIAANGSTLAIYQSSNNTFYRGRATASTLSRFARIPLPPQQAIKLLMGLVPDDEANFEAAPKSVRSEEGMVIGVYELPGGMVEELGFADGQLRMVRVDDSRGASYEVHYSEYKDIGGLQFAHHLEANFLNTGTQLSVSYSDVTINPILNDSEFTLVPQGTARQIDLDQPEPTGGNG